MYRLKFLRESELLSQKEVAEKIFRRLRQGDQN